MTYIVLDLEWNQPPINTKPCRCPFPLVGEIIEIGAVKLKSDFTPGDTFKTYIKPRFYPKMQPYVKKITGITEKTLHDAPDFKTGIENLFSFCGDDFAFITWGPDDLPMMCDNLLCNGMKTDIIPPAYNLQIFFSTQFEAANKQCSLSSACDFLGIDKQLPEHDALADAYRTALICTKLDMKRGIGEYPKTTTPKRHYEHIDSTRRKPLYPRKAAPDYTAGGFATVQDAIRSDGVSLIPCPVCGLPMYYDMFVGQAPDKKASLCTCRRHGKFFVLVRLTENDGRITATRTVYPCTERLKEHYERLEERAFSRHAPKQNGQAKISAPLQSEDKG